MSVILHPRRLSGLELLPLVGAFSIAQGIRKATGVIVSIRSPGTAFIEGHVVGKAFSSVKTTKGAELTVLLNMRIQCKIRSEQLGDLLADSPWPKNTLFVDPEILRDKVLESLEWVYSEWERGLDTILWNRIAAIDNERGHLSH